MIHLLTSSESAYSQMALLEKQTYRFSRQRFAQSLSIPIQQIFSNSNEPFDQLPICLYQILQQFLPTVDYLSLMNASKSLFKQIKYETVYYYLDSFHSKLYYYQLPFRHYLQKLVKDTSKQLALTFFTYEYSQSFDFRVLKNIHRVYLSYGCQLSSIAILNQGIAYIEIAGMKEIADFTNLSPKLRGMKISRFPKLKNIDGLKHLLELELHNCSEITDVSALGNLQKLTIISCQRIQDVSCLKKVHQLTFISCDGITDISCLSNVHDLSIHYCSNIRDIQPLKNNYKMSIIGCNNIISYEKCLMNVKEIFISNFPENDLGLLQQATQISISHSPQLSNLTKLPLNLRMINISYCTQIKEISSLRSLFSVKLDHCDYVNDVSMLGSVHTLVLSWLHKLTSLSGLGYCRFQQAVLNAKGICQRKDYGNQSVTIISCPHIHNFSSLQYVPHLVLESCLGFTNTNDVRNVTHLVLKYCAKVEKVSSLRNIQRLELIGCNSIQSIQDLSDVPYLTISDCSKIFDYHHLKNNQKIIIGGLFASPNGKESSSSATSPQMRMIYALEANEDYSCTVLKKKRIYVRKQSSMVRREAPNMSCLIL